MRIVLIADETLTSTYHNIPLLDFLGCAPYKKLPTLIYRILDTQVGDENGKLRFAPYALRKVESALLSDGYKENEVIVAHPKHFKRFIDEKTTIVGVSTMDPMGLGPVSMIFTEGGKYISYTKYKFMDLLSRINNLRKKKRYKFKIVVGGQGAWQLEIKEDERRKLGIDHIIIGETEHVIGELFRNIESGCTEEIIRIKTWPKIDDIPNIVNPTYKGMIEVTRGCGRGCKFCAPNLRIARHYPIEKIKKEVDVNLKAGIKSAWVHSEDIFMYQNEDRKNFYPNEDAIIELFQMLKERGLNHANPTHATVAGALASPETVKRISELFRNSGKEWIGVQVGLETASGILIKKHSTNKIKPFKPEEWQWVLLNGTYIFNKYNWYPAYTTILGLPDETKEEVIDTARLILTMKEKLKEKLGNKAHFTVTPLAFVPMGILKDKKFFDIKEDLNEERILLLYHTWRHLVDEINNSLSMILRGNPAYLLFNPLAHFGSRLVVFLIKKWALKNGVDVNKKLDLLDIEINV